MQVETEAPLSVGALVEVASVEDEAVRVLGQVVNRSVLEQGPGVAIVIEFADTEDRVAAFIRFMDTKGHLDGQANKYVKYIRARKGEGEVS